MIRHVSLRSLLLLPVLCLLACPGPGDEGQGPLDPPGWNDGVTLPEPQDLNPDPHVLEVELTAKVVEKELRPGQVTKVWTYNGLLPGPLFRVTRGDRVIVHFKNDLPEATTIHWHGLRVPASMDGTKMAQNPVEPGATFTYDFVLPDEGTYWYHPHMQSSHQVNAGLYGAFIVEPEEPRDLGAKQVLVLSDILLNPDGTLAPRDQGGWLGDYFGREGNVLLVNGRVRPTLKARTGRPQHWQVVNASRSRYYWFKLPGQKVYRVGGDAGAIPAPVPLDEVLLVPGERAELLVIPEGEAGETLTVTWLPYERGYATGMRPEEPLFDLEFSDLPALTPPPLPERLANEVPALSSQGAVPQSIQLTEENVDGQMVMGINGVAWPNDTPIMAHVGETQVWTVENTTDADHPFHLHGFFFQVLSVDGVPPPFRERKDTQNVPAKTTLKLAVRFDDRPGMWMFHCHILDHADLGMMGHLHLMPPMP